MVSISDHMTSEHKRCDEIYLAAEKAVTERNWPAARQAYKDFRLSIDQHFLMEEKVLFPDFEQAQGSEMGPTQVMRYEHEQMRSLMDSAQEALNAENADEFLGEAETLLMFMQQHNTKEEMMLYPMADQILAPQNEQVVARMQALAE